MSENPTPEPITELQTPEQQEATSSFIEAEFGKQPQRDDAGSTPVRPSTLEYTPKYALASDQPVILDTTRAEVFEAARVSDATLVHFLLTSGLWRT